MKIKSYAKINIGLDVISKREDNLHDLKTILAEINLYDVIKVKIIKDNKINIIDKKYKIKNEDNLIYKVLKLMKEKYNISDGFIIKINKKIPVGAGLGGGSSNAAVIINFINDYYHLNLSNQELNQISQSIGSDVPFFIKGGTALLHGKGSKLSVIDNNLNVYILLSCLNYKISTKEIFEQYDLENINKHPNIKQIVKGLKDNNINLIKNNIDNSLEYITTNKVKEIKEIEDIMKENNSLISIMSGSGPTVFGLFKNKKEAKKAKKLIKYKYNNENYILKFIERG